MEAGKRIMRAVGYGFSTLIIYLGVTLLGWGLGDLAGYFSDHPRLGYAVMVGCFSLAVGLQAYYAPEGINGGRGQEDKFVFRQRVLAIILVYGMFIALFLIPFFDRREIGVIQMMELFCWIGLALCASGYALVFTSGLALGRQYSPDVTIQKDHQLVTSGVYRYIRHPRYLGVICLAVGVPFVFRSWIGLIACLFFTWLVFLRIRDEELTMGKAFGTEWEAYCAHTWRLFPNIY